MLGMHGAISDIFYAAEFNVFPTNYFVLDKGTKL